MISQPSWWRWAISISLLPALVLPALGQERKKGQAVSAELAKIYKLAIAELAKLQALMVKYGCKAEAADCDAIALKLQVPHEAMSERESTSDFPGEEVYEKVLAAWSSAGEALAKIYGDGAVKLEGDDSKEAEFFKGWFATFPDLAAGIRHLNRRRKFCKLPLVTQDWSGSIGGYFHGLYLNLNHIQSSMSGNIVHVEQPGQPGWTAEGSKAARAILGWSRSAPESIDMWLNSRFHRDPVLNPTCVRVSLGGMPRGVYSCRSAGSTRSRPPADVMTWPGDGDTEIPRTFSGESPNPFPGGMKSSGTVIVVMLARRLPAGVEYELLGPDGKPVDTLFFDMQPLCFAAKSSLAAQSKYTVRIRGAGGLRHSFSFTTK